MKTITRKLKGEIYMKYYSLTEEQEERFSILAREKKELITKGLYKVKIPKPLHREFYNFGLEGLLVSFLMLEDGAIEAYDFDKFALTVIKRKLIDEIRRRNKDKSVAVDYFNNTLLHSCNNDKDILEIDLNSYLTTVLTKQELAFLEDFKKTQDIKKTSKNLNLSLSTCYRLFKRIKEIYIIFLFKTA
jgi:RNA polymerase sigma factor, sigma-70 family